MKNIDRDMIYLLIGMSIIALLVYFLQEIMYS